ncbi:MAG: Zn-dependent alcohol dehydrogenase [Acidimicrobiales bacterium]|mgnify:CR=1 FL=1|jgi:Zn-dependent alcohol dehydrogenase|nr:Zn-dependent alcohol dehydrogenase [Acidimicrobiales bacterium]MDP6298619.1 Zn-dependent alcohol dehydrogenase [Acidimicrobiales bacterium]HJM27709.1 Zn-dependent alcohol dehydrogenase [Acidimicrobiales bacterium]HJM97224.1 Zn-dependent alcohol dehydrogenase [Acidimicrobiales bacterium]
MKAAVVTQPDQPLVIQDIDIEEPRATEVLVRIHHCGICHSDLSILDLGGAGQLPVILGHEAAGVIETIGSDVTSVTPGDKVLLTPLAPCGQCYWCSRAEPTGCPDAQSFTSGLRPDGTSPFSQEGTCVHRGLGVAGFSEMTIVPESGVVKLDPDTPLDIACVIGCAVQTGVGAVLNSAKVEVGATILVTGLGGIGISIVQGARIAGAGKIIVSDPVPERREAAFHFGATHSINPQEDDVVTKVLQETKSIGVDYAFEAAGVASLVDTCINASRIGGTTIIVGADVSLSTVPILPVMIATTGKKIIGSLLGDCHPQRDIPKFVNLWKSGQLDLEAMISHRVKLEEINSGFDNVRETNGIRTVVEVAS